MRRWPWRAAQNWGQNGNFVVTILTIFNEHGKVVFTKAVPSSIAEFADNAMKAQPEEVLDRKFTPTGRSYLFE